MNKKQDTIVTARLWDEEPKDEELQKADLKALRLFAFALILACLSLLAIIVSTAAAFFSR